MGGVKDTISSISVDTAASDKMVISWTVDEKAGNNIQTIEIWLNGEKIETIRTDESGTYEFTDFGKLKEGDNTLAIRTKNAFGQYSEWTEKTFTYDPAEGLEESAITSVEQQKAVLSGAAFAEPIDFHVTITWTPASGAGVTGYEILLDDNVIASDIEKSETSFVYYDMKDNKDGDYTFTIKTLYGERKSEGSSISFHYDRTAPEPLDEDEMTFYRSALGATTALYVTYPERDDVSFMHYHYMSMESSEETANVFTYMTHSSIYHENADTESEFRICLFDEYGNRSEGISKKIRIADLPIRPDLLEAAELTSVEQQKAKLDKGFGYDFDETIDYHVTLSWTPVSSDEVTGYEILMNDEVIKTGIDKADTSYTYTDMNNNQDGDYTFTLKTLYGTSVAEGSTMKIHYDRTAPEDFTEEEITIERGAINPDGNGTTSVYYTFPDRNDVSYFIIALKDSSGAGNEVIQNYKTSASINYLNADENKTLSIYLFDEYGNKSDGFSKTIKIAELPEKE